MALSARMERRAFSKCLPSPSVPKSSPSLGSVYMYNKNRANINKQKNHPKRPWTVYTVILSNNDKQHIRFAHSLLL